MSDRVEQMLSEVTRDARLDISLAALEQAQESLIEALDMTNEINLGFVPDVAGLDVKIQDALVGIDEVVDENFTIKNRKNMMRSLIMYTEKHKEK